MHEPDFQQETVKYELTDEQLTELLQTLRCPDEDVAPRPGFYAKVMDRIEAQQKSSIWSIFLEPVFSKRLAFASMAMIVLLGVALFNANPQDDDEFADTSLAPIVYHDGIEGHPTVVLGAQPDALQAQPVATMDTEQGRNVVLVDLVSYQEH